MTIQKFLFGWRRTRTGEAFRRVGTLVIYLIPSPAGWAYRIGPFESEAYVTADAAVAAAYLHLAGSGLL